MTENAGWWSPSTGVPGPHPATSTPHRAPPLLRGHSAGVFEFCSGLVDLVVCVRHHRGGGHRLTLAGEREAPSQRVQGSPCSPRGRPG
jgi:hypothetical protein